MRRSLGPLSTLLEDVPLPGDVLDAADLSGLLGSVHVLDFRPESTAAGESATVWLAVDGEASVRLFGLPGVRLVVGESQDGLTFVTATLSVGERVAVTLHGFRLALRVDRGLLDGADGSGAPAEIAISGTLTIDSDLAVTATDVRLSGDAGGLVDLGDGLDLRGFHLDRQCLAASWSEPDLGRWLAQLSPNVHQQGPPPVESDVTLRVRFGDTGIDEIRLDATVSGAQNTFVLPGLTLRAPPEFMLTLLLGAGPGTLADAAVALTLVPGGSDLVAESAFAWERGEERELHNDDKRPPNAAPLLQATAGPKRRVTLVLLTLRLTELKLPQFFQELAQPLDALRFDDLPALCAPTPFDPGGLSGDSWTLGFELNADIPFTLPFLKDDAGAGNQFITIGRPQLTKVTAEGVTLSVPVRVRIGRPLEGRPLELGTECDLAFNWQTFALTVDHSKGLDLYADDEKFEPAEEHLGLKWRLKGKRVTRADGEVKYHYFTLATKDHNYQLQQADGAAFEVNFVRASDEPITFSVTDFALTPKGLDVTATVTDRPAKLNGIDTRFRFNNTRLEIKENRVEDFTLSGSGPLPPDLVGESTVDISLQLRQVDGGLKLVAGGAQLRGNKLLDCRGTRFQFSVDGLGLRFVDDGRFRLYFLVTGSARFTPAPGDDANGPLALLSNITIDLVECPLTGDVSVIGKHVKFLVTLPKPKSFNFLGAFEMELRGIGFLPQADVFDGDAAMLLTGQLKFVQGPGDGADSRVDLHSLYIGLPERGGFLPRLHFSELPVHINFGSAFRLNGSVKHVNTSAEQGFLGEGTLQIQGLPTIAANFSFLRVRRDELSPWLRAWFIYIEVRQVSFMIPVVQLYLREVGLGFGYRYTLVSIQAADRTNDVRKLLQELKALSRTQGDLSRRDRWTVDLEEPGDSPRCTIALRAMISQTSASPSPLRWEETAERQLACAFLLDAVIALRSDLTFLMAARAWLSANYYDYVTDADGIRSKPMFTGFVLLSPRQKRFLANLSSNPDGRLGGHPPLPELVQKALAGAQFSATLLIEPGLFHTELGWPNMLRWTGKLGPLDAELRGGFVFRISTTELMIGLSFLARASLQIDAGLDLGLVGVRVSASASVAYGARYIGVLDFRDPGGASAIYGAMGIEAQVHLAIEFWIRIPLVFTSITKSFRFSVNIGFTAGIEAGFVGISLDGAGIRGSATLSASVMGHAVQLSVKIGVNEAAVETALRRTQRFLNVGLEATDVEPVPGIGAARALASPSATTPIRRAPGGVPMTARRRQTAPTVLPAIWAAATVTGTFEAPDYTIFVIRGAGDGQTTYWVLLPRGEAGRGTDSQRATTEIGFLPVPPDDRAPSPVTVVNDFRIRIPLRPEDGTLEQYDPMSGWVRRDPVDGAVDFTWTVRWDAPIAPAQPYRVDGEVVEPLPPTEYTVAQYLRHAFLTHGDTPEDLVATGDPEPLPPLDARAVQDARVHDPTETAFEAAVRGAIEQFRGSPFFKRDTGIEYDRLLDEAFREDTTVYHGDGVTPPDPAEVASVQQRQQALQLRGLVVSDIVGDLRDYVQAVEAGADSTPAPDPRSIAFAMGLVFCHRGPTLPVWLDEIPDEPDATPTIWQRLGPQSTEPSDVARTARTFNVAATDFSRNPPQFRRVQELTDANTIALAWELGWDQPPNKIDSDAQTDPEHHLMHYEVRRRALDGSERDAAFTVKTADALHLSEGQAGAATLMQRLRPRFRVVDHFTHESLDDLAALPAAGRSYLYTITPVDFAGARGRPLSVVATRFPNEPPLVPTDADLLVGYRLTPEQLSPEVPGPPTTPRILLPSTVQVTWTEPRPAQGKPGVPADAYRLVFRRTATLPIGSFGLDGSTQGPRAAGLPTSNARALPTDIAVTLDPTGPAHDRSAAVTVEDLQQAGVLPGGPSPVWRPESWRVFIQTLSRSGVPSALAPADLLLRAEPASSPEDADGERREERRPGELEWPALPMRFEPLAPEDGRATVGPAHVPMAPAAPLGSPFDLAGAVRGVVHGRHPAGLRCVSLRWNQGPSADPVYPLQLNAGFHLLELDVDGHTRETLTDRDALGRALKTVQDVQMIPAEDLPLVPADTLAPSQWEAWYPSARLRRRDPEARAGGSEVAETPWLSWRESWLEWPEWPGLTDGGSRSDALHPLLARIVAELAAPSAEGTLTVDLQPAPPIAPGDLLAFLRSTAPKVDPHGWAVLQRFGLSTAFSLRDGTGTAVTGAPLYDALATALRTVAADADLVRHLPHLHIEALYQPGRSVSLQERPADPAHLLATVQLSLRPTFRQYLAYRRVEVSGPAGEELSLVLTVPSAAAPCSLVDRNDPASGQTDVEPPADPAQASILVQRRVRLPLTGGTTILLQCATAGADTLRIGLALSAVPQGALPAGVEYVELPTRQLVLSRMLDDDKREQLRSALAPDDKRLAAFKVGVPVPFVASDEDSTVFTVPATLASMFAPTSATDGGGTTAADQWLRFKRYAEALNSTSSDVPSDQRIDVPTARDAIQAILPRFLAWSLRFFASAGGATFDATTRIAQPGTGPWLATAYPRAGSPAHAAPDAAGRLTYTHLLDDPWAHAYRYYVRPYGRYDALWQSLRTSPALSRLAPANRALQPVTPDPDAGGIDVVLERTRGLDPPVVLSSTRLDAASTPVSPARPGRVWEVVLARHPEQALAERNATLARQLAFRQVAFTLLRRFAYRDWITQLEAVVGDDHTIEIELVQDAMPAIPTTLPDVPDVLDPAAGLDEDDARTLDLPERVRSFQQAALVLQWDALPFYYEHRMLVAAQSDTTVSAVNEMIQRDFEYRAPEPSGEMRGTRATWQPRAPFDPAAGPVETEMRRLDIPLARLWDVLPPDAQADWQAEAPRQDATTAARRLSSLPDPDVVYQIVELFGGNVEVQAEIAYNFTGKAYAVRQLGQRLLADVVAVAPPAASSPQGPYVVQVTLQQVTEEQLATTFSPVGLPAPTRAKLAVDDRRLKVVGVLTSDDLAALALVAGPEDRATFERIHQTWYAEEPLSQALDSVPPELTGRVDFPEAGDCILVWTGPIDDSQRQELLALPGDPVFKDGLQRLAAAAERPGSDTVVERVAPGPEQVPEAVRALVALEVTDGQVRAFTWTGPLLAPQEAVLRGWTRIPQLVATVDALVAAQDGQVVAVPLPAGAERPSADSLPESLRQNLWVNPESLEWRGRVVAAEQLEALEALVASPAFDEAADALAARLHTATTRVALELPLRPQQADLPTALQDQLLLGRARIRHHGLMTADEARAMRERATSAGDHSAIHRLYVASLRRGLDGRELRIRARRGSATPSALQPIESGAPS